MIAAARANPWLATLLDRFDVLNLPNAWITAGAVAQSLWNRQAGRPATAGIADIDIAYHDPADLSEEGEAAHEARLRAAFPDIPVRLDVKNQARVHLWYPSRFGRSIAPYTSVPEAIATFPTTAGSIGLRPHAICTPFGTADLQAGIIRANRRLASRAVFEAKAARWAAQWPQLIVLPWESGVD